MTKNRIVLITCPPWAVDAPHLAVAMLAEWLVTLGWPVSVLDLNSELFDCLSKDQSTPTLWSQQASSWWLEPGYSKHTRHRIAPYLARVAERIRLMVPAFVGLSLPSTDSYSVASDLALRLRAICPDLVIIGGGVGVRTSLREENDTSSFDYVVNGEGEHALATLLETLSREDFSPEEVGRIPGVMHGAAHKDPLEQPQPNTLVDRKAMGLLPFPRYELFDLERYGQVVLLASRGCIYRCRFCDEITRYGRYQPMNPEWVLEAMRYYRQLGFR